MPIGIYDTVTMAAVVRNLKLPSQFLLDTAFPNIMEYDTKSFAIDVDAGKRRIAPFVSPLVAGKPVESRRIATTEFAPAYIKDKRALDPMRPVIRALGERIGGVLSAADREMANLAFEMEDQVQMVQRRLEWMASSALTTGTITVTGEGYPTVVVDFQRDRALTLALVGAAQWTETNIGTVDAPGAVSPASNVQNWSRLLLQKSGAVATDLVFTQSAYDMFLLDRKVIGAVRFRRSGDSDIDFGGGVTTGALDMGYWGTYRLWLYNDWFVDPATDIEQPMVPDGTVIVLSRQMQGVRAFGAIIDPQFAYGALAFAPKSWVEQDPAQRWLMMQSAPMVVPSRVNASMAITVR
jgi:hypothetical protein